MIPVYILINKLLKISTHILFLFQILCSVMIVLTASYWFFDLIGMNFLSFLRPMISVILKIVHSFYHQQVQISGEFFDGGLLLFDLILLFVIIAVAKFKCYIKLAEDENNRNIQIRKAKIEEEFNVKLKKETEKKISKLKNTAILIEFEMRNCRVSDLWGRDKEAGVKEKIEEAFKDFQNALKGVSDCKMAKTDNKMLILNEQFDDIENLLDAINNTVSALKLKYRKLRWVLNFYAGIDLYGEDLNLNVKEVYPTLQSLVELKIPNEILSLGAFNIRYNMLAKQTYEVLKKGYYYISGQDNTSIWTIIKKF